MKKVLSFTVFIFTLILSCNQSDDGVNEEQIELNPLESYRLDASQLYIEEIFKDNTHPNYESPILDESEIDKIYGIIQAVYVSNSPQRDTIFDVYQLHKLHCNSLSAIYLKVDTDRAEIRSLAENIIPTGEQSLDDLLINYGFDSVRTALSYPQSPWLTVYTDDQLNLLPIEKLLNEIESIEIAGFEKESCGNWTSSDITLSRNGNTATITFRLGWGDCPSGCMNFKYWEFKVSNGVAEFIRTY